MRAFGLLASLALSMAAHAQARAPAERCVSACMRFVEKGVVPRTACQACIFSPDVPTAWLGALSPVPASLLLDQDWRVRFAAIHLEARRKKVADERVLATWIAQATGPERQAACLTAAYAAGAANRTLDEELAPALAGEPSAKNACTAARAAVLARVAQELATQEPALRKDALALLPKALGTSAARLVLDAMQGLPPERDTALALDLSATVWARGEPVGHALLTAATAADTAGMNRLLAVYAQVRDAQRPLLDAPTVNARKEAVRALAPLAPLSVSELLVAFADPSPEVRRLAGKALAAGEGRTLEEAVAARLDGRVATTTVEQLKWLALLGPQEKASCTTHAQRLWRDRGQPDSVRAEALATLAGCAGSAAMEEIELAAKAGSRALQLGAVRAAAQVPRDGRAASVLVAGLHSDDEAVLLASLDGVAAQGSQAALEPLEPLCGHPSAPVRRRALEVLGGLDHARAEPLAAARLSTDPDSEVRATAAEVLGQVGSPRIASVLAKAAQNDSDARVKFIAGNSLRKLGFPVPTGASRP